jgi:organic radical activating enzyme
MWEELCVIVGYRCTMSCAHCCTHSAPQAKGTLQEADFARLEKALTRPALKYLSFSGGEPTLFVTDINRLIEMTNKDDSPEIIITTNGWFAGNSENVNRVLSKLKKIDRLNFSADNNHELDFKSAAIQNLKTWCQKLKVRFSVSYSYLGKSDLTAFAALKSEHPEVEFTIEPVQPKGRARNLVSEYDFRIANGAKFGNDAKITGPASSDIFCPSRGVVTYYPGLGFSACCAGGPIESIQEAHLDLAMLESSRFFNEMNATALNRLADSNGKAIVIPNSVKSECGACDYVCSVRRSS